MTVTGALIGFTIAAAILTITPGLDTALVLRTAAMEGPRQGMLAGGGITIGVLVWGIVSAAGLGAAFAASTLAYNVIRIAGALYLVYLGLRLVVSTFARDSDAELRLVTADRGYGRAGGIGWFTRGLLTNLLNPKVGLFYVTFLPQFLPADVNVFLFSFLLAAIHAVQGIVWFFVLTRATQRAAALLNRVSVRRTLDRALGLLFLSVAVKLAFAKRP